MPWTTPPLRQVREMVRGEITAKVAGASYVGNSVLRVMADAMAALAHLTLRYLDWLARQLLPDTAETEWLDRHGDIWLVNADGSIGRKTATYAKGNVLFTGLAGMIVPSGSLLDAGTTLQYQTTIEVVLSASGGSSPVVALTAGTASNLQDGTPLSLTTSQSGIDGVIAVGNIDGGTDSETDDELRARVLRRIQQPPMGGDANDYVAWTLAVPGVTRAWCYPLEMGIGTVTVRFMCDDLRAASGGFPWPEDIENVEAYLNEKRPVAVKDIFVVSPIPFPIDFNVINLVKDTPTVRGEIQASIEQMLFEQAAPGQTIFVSWKYSAVSSAAGVSSFDLQNNTDDVMPSPGHMAVLGDLFFGTTP